MSRVANQPVTLPKGVEVNVTDELLTVKGPKGQMQQVIPSLLKLEQVENELRVAVADEDGDSGESGSGRGLNPRALAGTIRSLVNNIVIGVSQGFERKLTLHGVGYRAQAQGKVLNLTLGLSHPVNHQVPEGITIETPSQTEVLVKGMDKQLVGQVAADIRAYRPPEPYKGKGIRYADENIVRKEVKKK